MSKPNTKFISRTMLYSNGDRLTLETTKGYYPDPDRRVWRVMFGEYVDDSPNGNTEYSSNNMELFTNRGTAIRAFDLRVKSDKPAESSGITLNVLEPQSLADILLQGALG